MQCSLFESWWNWVAKEGSPFQVPLSYPACEVRVNPDLLNMLLIMSNFISSSFELLSVWLDHSESTRLGNTIFACIQYEFCKAREPRSSTRHSTLQLASTEGFDIQPVTRTARQFTRVGAEFSVVWPFECNRQRVPTVGGTAGEFSPQYHFEICHGL